jgi:hypothetical protein
MKQFGRATVGVVATIRAPDPLPAAIARPRQHVQAVLAQSLVETGRDGRAALAWAWALTGSRPSPVTLSLAPGRPLSREELLAEADADPEGTTAPPGVPTDYCDQIGEARRILSWLSGVSDDLPLDDEQRGRFIGARDDYARSDAEIRQVRDAAARCLADFDMPDPIDPTDAAHPWRWDPAWMNATWQRGVRDLLDWVLGDRSDGPLTGIAVGMPAVHDLSYEESASAGVIAENRGSGLPVAAATCPPPQYGEAIQATIAWLRGESRDQPVDRHGTGPYSPAGA